jgi:hypothetical protein
MTAVRINQKKLSVSTQTCPIFILAKGDLNDIFLDMLLLLYLDLQYFI